MYLGIDIGSSSSKTALMDENRELLGTAVVNMGTGSDGVRQSLEELLEHTRLSKEQVKFTVVTGYGRITYTEADKQITEISCHAKGIGYLMKNIKTVIDIGGQDAKVIRIGENGKVENFVMNEKCAAGTGRFMEVMARVLGCDLMHLSDMYESAKKIVPISSVCTVFAESEVISQLAAGEKREDVAKGAHMAIAKRVAGMCGRVGGCPKYAMSGGVALNRSMAKALEVELGYPVQVAPYPQSVGAIGAALAAWEACHKK